MKTTFLWGDGRIAAAKAGQPRATQFALENGTGVQAGYQEYPSMRLPAQAGFLLASCYNQPKGCPKNTDTPPNKKTTMTSVFKSSNPKSPMGPTCSTHRTRVGD